MSTCEDIFNSCREFTGKSDWQSIPDKAASYIKSNVSAVTRAFSTRPKAINLKKNFSKVIKSTSKNTELNSSRAKIWHYDLYITDGYINQASGAWPPAGDNTAIAGWNEPIYIWGFTDADPNISGNLMTVPEHAIAPANSPVGNAKFPGPFIEACSGDDVFITVHNRGFFQKMQSLQDDQSLKLHGICCQAPYNGFPEAAGGYGENLRYFWEEDWYKEKGANSKERDTWWNSLGTDQQQSHLRNTPLIKPNQLNQNGCIYSFRNEEPYPDGVGSRLPYGDKEDWTQFTYHFRAENPGSFMYCSQSVTPEHMHMGMFGALIVRPSDYSSSNKSVYGSGTDTDFDQEYTFLLGEFDPQWHRYVEGDPEISKYSPSDWRPSLWFINGRTFPMTMLPFAWNRQGGNACYEPRYNTHIKAAPKHDLLVRYINAGFQAQSLNQQGWQMRVVGGDGFLWDRPVEKYTLTIAPGESFEAISAIEATFGVNSEAGSPLSSVAPAPIGPGTLTWRQVYSIKNQDDRKSSTEGTYPGGMMTVIEATGATNVPAGKPTWMNPYTEKVEPLP